ncbi:Gfo/Idh/MocA family protein [Polynucleobacter sp. Adler-ghost]|uniref:Gfo/Idh/MocA family protein n=1 Tax=Polynucleobacter sp. Adler-ghost TaxID=2770234 RepID=UPI001BFCF8D0|nr:Gfo/Idh/MocA family oxidoreductase [Polynucleobacter sp. Adler-ghost]
MPANNLLKVGIIGCGRIAGHHCDSIVKTENAELIAVCDIEIEKAISYSKKYEVKHYCSYHEMLKMHPEINTVAIITPSGMHLEHAVDVIRRYKKNIIIEKPTLMKPSQFEAVRKLALESNIKIYPVFQNRHNKAVQRTKLALQSSELGRIHCVSVRVRWCRTDKYYQLSPWRGTFSMDGGCLANQGIHHIDLLQYLGGKVRCVSSLHKTIGSNIEVEDVAVAVLEFEEGHLGILEVTTAARPHDYEASISLVCEKGLAQIGGIAVNELQVFTPEPSACIEFSEDFSGNIYGNGHSKVYEEIVKSLNESQPFSVSIEEAESTIQLLNSFYISDETRSWVDVSNAGDSTRLGSENELLSSMYKINDYEKSEVK